MKNMVRKILFFIKTDYKKLLINSVFVAALLVIFSNFTEKNSSVMKIHEENGPINEYSLKNDLVADYQQILTDLKALSFRYGFFTVREFLPNSPQYKLFVVYFKNNEGFSLSLEPVSGEYKYVYRIGRLKPNGEYTNSGNERIVYAYDEYHKLNDVIVKYLFGRVPIQIKTKEDE